MGARDPFRCAVIGRAACAASLAVLSAGCGGDGVLLDPGTGGGDPDAPTLTSLQTEIFTPKCAFEGCHAGTSSQQGLRLEEGLAHAYLVGVPSTELPDFRRVEPKNAADSYVVMKLAGDARIFGERMPYGGPYLTSAEIEAVRAWIDAGARDD